MEYTVEQKMEKKKSSWVWFTEIAIFICLGSTVNKISANPIPAIQKAEFLILNQYLTTNNFIVVSGQATFELIEKANNNTDQKLFEGDIIFDKIVQDVLTPPLWKQKGIMMDAVRNLKNLWITRSVPYEIEEDFSRAEQGKIVDAMKIIEEKSCIQFKRHENETNWIIIKKSKGCFSAVGRQYWKKGAQFLSLGNGCIEQSIILHELLHSLGFWHEQSRPDRDKYVQVFWENIKDDYLSQFEKHSREKADLLNLPYDYRSIMHYTRTSASKNGKPTILAIGNKSQELGNSKTLTPTDLLQLNKLYDCSEPGASREGYTSNWSEFGPCDYSCNKKRQRFCTQMDISQCPGAQSNGVEEEVVKCTTAECYAPINGHWTRWSDWGECFPNCGTRKQSRKRYCSNPEPKYGGKPCIGNNIDSVSCEPKYCSVECTFDDDWCGWRNSYKNSYRFYWRRNRLNSPSAKTGPSKDHTSGKGSYIYVEASHPSIQGENASVISKSRNATKGECLSFWYHMYGEHMGGLRVLIKSADGVTQKLWGKYGNQGDKWIYAEITVKSLLSYQVLFEAERGTDFTGDAAIDDTKIRSGECGKGKLEELIGVAMTAVGCFGDSLNDRAMPNLLSMNRQLIRWKTYNGSLKTILRSCAQKAKGKGDKFFGLQFYGECWSSSDEKEPFKHGLSKECVNGLFQECSVPKDEPCTGKANANYIYKLV